MLRQRMKGRGDIAKSSWKATERPIGTERRFGIESNASATSKQTRPSICRVHPHQVHPARFTLQESLRCADKISPQPKGGGKIISAACREDPQDGVAIKRGVRQGLKRSVSAHRQKQPVPPQKSPARGRFEFADAACVDKLG